MKLNNTLGMAVIIFIIFTILLVAFPINIHAQTEDTTPPSVVEFSFSPDAVDVSSGDQAITVTARITDDSSGFRDGGFSFCSPTGQQIASVSMDSSNRISGTALDGIYQNSMEVHQISLDGVWHFCTGGIWDQLSNVTVFNEQTFIVLGFPTTFTVTSLQHDTTPPSVVEFSFSPDAVDVSSGDQAITVTARITDDSSGFRDGGFSFCSPTGQQIASVSMDSSNRISGTALDGIYQNSMEVHQISLDGVWHFCTGGIWDQLSNVTVFNEQTFIVLGFPTTFTVTSLQHDTTPPSVVEFSFSPDAVDVSSGDQAITVTARITDDSSGFRDGGFSFCSPTGQQIASVSMDSSNRISGTALDGIYQNSMEVHQISLDGVWHFCTGGIWDQLSNVTVFNEQTFIVLGFPTTFTVISTIDDTDGDGIPDNKDACPFSDLRDTVIIDGCDSGVENVLLEDGCTISDLIWKCADEAVNHGEFVSSVSHTTNSLKKSGIISGKKKGKIQKCAANANIP